MAFSFFSESLWLSKCTKLANLIRNPLEHVLHSTEFANFGETIPRPHRGSKPVPGGPRVAKSSS
jgi:hypothetical protein